MAFTSLLCFPFGNHNFVFYACFVSSFVSFFWIPHKSSIIWYLSFSVWLTSLSIMISTFTQVAANGIVSFFLMVEQYSIVYMCHTFLIHSFVDGHCRTPIKVLCSSGWCSMGQRSRVRHAPVLMEVPFDGAVGKAWTWTWTWNHRSLHLFLIPTRILGHTGKRSRNSSLFSMGRWLAGSREGSSIWRNACLSPELGLMMDEAPGTAQSSVTGQIWSVQVWDSVWLRCRQCLACTLLCFHPERRTWVCGL